MLKLYHFVLATCGTKVRLVLAEKGLDYQEVILDVEAGDLGKPGYLKLNPEGFVPTLVHDDLVLTESSVIMRYLDDKFSGVALAPNSAEKKSRMNMWLKLSDELYLPALGTLTYSTLKREKFSGDQDAIQRELKKTTNHERRAFKEELLKNGVDSKLVAPAIQTLKGMLDRIDLLLEDSAYLVGEDYSLADAALTPFVYRLSLMNLLSVSGVRHTRLDAWWERIQNRSSFESVICSRVELFYVEACAAVGEKNRDRIQSIMLNKKLP